MLTSASRLKEAAYAVLFPTLAFVTISNSLFEIFSSVFIGLCVLAVIIERPVDKFKNPFFWMCALYVVANLLSVTQSQYLFASVRGVFKMFQSLAMCLGAWYVVDSNYKLRRLFQWVLIVALIVTADALAQQWIGHDLFRNRQMTPYYVDLGRMTGPFRHANDFASYLSLVFFLFLGPLVLSEKRPASLTVILWIGLVLTFYCLVHTYSRSAWLTVGFCCLLLAITQRNKFLIGGLIGFFIWLTLFSPAPLKHRIASLVQTGYTTVTERQLLWMESVRMIEQKPVFGFGVNTYSRNEPKFKTTASDNQYAHNGYLQIGAEIGLFGLASFLGLLFVLLRKVAARPTFFFAILSFLIQAALDTSLQSLLLANFLWICMGLALAAADLPKQAPAHR